MLFELYEVQRQQTFIQNLQENRQKTYDKLVLSYSKKDKSQKSLRQKFQFILKQSALLIHILRQIQQEVKHKNLLPRIFDNGKIDKLLYSRIDLPEWFQHVFQKQYQKQRHNLQIVGLKIYKLHGLAEKNQQIVKEHWNLETLFSRYQSLNQKQLENIDIIKQVESFKRLYDSCKEIFRNFLDMMTKKVLQFLEKIVQSTMMYSNNIKKVKSFDNLPKYQSSHTFISNSSKIASNNRLQMLNLGSSNKNNYKFSDYQSIGHQDYNLNSNLYTKQIDKTVHKIPTKISLVDHLKQKQISNNQIFLRKSRQNNILNQTSLTKKIINVRPQFSRETYEDKSESDYRSRINKPPTHYHRRKQSGQVDENLIKADNILKRYNSSSNLGQNQINYNRKIDNSNKFDTSQNILSRNTAHHHIQTARSNEKKCLHHCPHHDKNINNHCSKHCNNICGHQKLLKNNLQLNLNQMDRKFYENKQKERLNGFISDRSVYQNKSVSSRSKEPTQRLKTLRMNNIYTSPDREYEYRNTSRSKRQPNLAENRAYLRNSHQKHLSSTKYSPFVSPDKQNFRSFETKRTNQYSFSRSPQHNRQNPAIRVSQYYFN